MIWRRTTGSADLRLKEDLGLLTTKGEVHGTGERARRARQAQRCEACSLINGETSNQVIRGLRYETFTVAGRSGRHTLGITLLSGPFVCACWTDQRLRYR